MKPSETGSLMTGRVYAQFATAGGELVKLRSGPAGGVEAKCDGCGSVKGGCEYPTREWIQKHAKRCTQRAGVR